MDKFDFYQDRDAVTRGVTMPDKFDFYQDDKFDFYQDRDAVTRGVTLPDKFDFYQDDKFDFYQDRDDVTRGVTLPVPVEVIIDGKSHGFQSMKFLPMDLVKTFKEDVTMLVPDMPTSMEAFHMGKIMLDDEPMKTYKIKSGSKVVVYSVKSMVTTVIDAFRPTLEVTTVIDGVWKHGLEVDFVTTMLVRAFKDKVAELVLEMPMSMEVFHKGNIMLDAAPMNAYNIKDGDKVVMHSVKKPQDCQDAEVHTVPAPGEDGYMLVTRQEPRLMAEDIFNEYSSSSNSNIFRASAPSWIGMKKKAPTLEDDEEFPDVVCSSSSINGIFRASTPSWLKMKKKAPPLEDDDLYS